MDRIDLGILKLLQQRNKLSAQIGQVKRRHGAAVYVPHRETELLARIARLNRGRLPLPVITAIYREIMSNSRAVQGQKPLGLLRTGAAVILLPARWRFGACDEFEVRKSWADLSSALRSGRLTLGLLTTRELAGVCGTSKKCQDFVSRFVVVGDFGAGDSPDEHVWVVMARGQPVAETTNRVLFLIECKSTVNTVKKVVKSMTSRSVHATEVVFPAGSARRGTTAIVLVALSKSVDSQQIEKKLLIAGEANGGRISLMGAYQGPDNYGG